MYTIVIPSENDFRRWIKEAIKECLGNVPSKLSEQDEEQVEPFLSRKEMAGVIRISLPTLHDWMHRGLPCHKIKGRVYFLCSEVVDFIKSGNRNSHQKEAFLRRAVQSKPK
jgi:hypothetical protein